MMQTATATSSAAVMVVVTNAGHQVGQVANNYMANNYETRSRPYEMIRGVHEM